MHACAWLVFSSGVTVQEEAGFLEYDFLTWICFRLMFSSTPDARQR